MSRNTIVYSDSTALCDISIRLGQLSTKPSDGDSLPNVSSETKPQNNGGNQKSDSLTSFTIPSTDSKSVPRNISNILLASKV